MTARPSFETLARRHSELEAMIEAEERRPHPDEILLATMKKKKLSLKDSMAASHVHAHA